MNWEDWLRQAVEPSTDNEEQKYGRTEDQVRAALRAWPALRGKPYRVYVKGSYANNTNVRLNYDVDIAVEYNGFFFYDLQFELEGATRQDAGITPNDSDYGTGDFKNDVLDALTDAFGYSAVTPGNIAYRIREQKTTLPADVVPCWEYRRYERMVAGQAIYEQGSRVIPARGAVINNFPQQQLDNGISKNKRTGYRYKRMVRALKRLQTKLVDDGLLDEEIPSYIVECLVYNVADGNFGSSSYKADMREVLAVIFNATMYDGGSSNWLEVNELKYLFWGDKKKYRAQAHRLASEAWDMLGFG